MSGHRRTGHNASHRGRAFAVASIVSVVAAVAVIAAVAVVLRTGSHPAEAAAPRKTAAVMNSPMTVEPSARDYVPDACATLSSQIAGALVPGGEQTQMDPNNQSDQQTGCVWSAYASAHPRQLSVELRAISASGRVSAISEATRTFATERAADMAGQNLPGSAQVKSSRDISGVGEAAYAAYDIDPHGESGMAVVNVRFANVLVTVHFSGNDNGGTGSAGNPLSADATINGGLEAARALLAQLAPQGR